MRYLVFILLLAALMVALSFKEARAINPEDILLALPLDELGGEVAEDLSPFGNDGALMGDPKWVDGKFDKALEFSGVNDYLDLGDNRFLLDEVTVAFWANKIGSGRDCCPTYFIVREADASGCGIFFAAPPKTLRVFCFKPATFGEQTVVQDGTTADDDWHHIVGQWSASSGMKLYIDGVLVGSKESFTATPADLEETNTYIARGRTHAPIEYVVGAIDEVLVVRGILTDEQVQLCMDLSVADFVAEVFAVQPSDRLATTWASIKGK